METLEDVHHQTSLNCHTAQLEPDAGVRFVVTHHDPGVDNWLDTTGHTRGTVGVRWVGPDVVDVVLAIRVVKVSSPSEPLGEPVVVSGPRRIVALQRDSGASDTAGW